MAKKSIPLGNIPQNWYMFWTITTQAAYKICITLSDSDSIYINNDCRQSTNPLPPLSQGFQQVAGQNLVLDVNVDQSSNLQFVTQPYAIPDKNGNIVGQGYNILMEDSGDNDFNDLLVSIIAWRAKA